MTDIGNNRHIPSDQNMMKPQMRNSYEFRLVQVSSYSGQTVESFDFTENDP